MSLKIAIHLRGGQNRTDSRSEALRDALEAHGYPCTTSDRNVPVKGSELVIQTGFASSDALKDAIDRRMPYIIMEAPFFRDFYDIDKASSWGYNGLAGGAWRPPAPETPRPRPVLKPLKEEGGTLIIGQKPTDHSLRGSDHVQWLLDRFTELPEADFRPHPLMVPENSLEPLGSALKRTKQVVVYNSTSAVEALCAGCDVRADGPGHLLPAVGRSREQWAHDLSWSSGHNSELGHFIPYILSGYDEALSRSKAGLFEVPRERIDGQVICERYHRAIVCRTTS